MLQTQNYRSTVRLACTDYTAAAAAVANRAYYEHVLTVSPFKSWVCRVFFYYFFANIVLVIVSLTLFIAN